jgi:hypothetical protein
MAAPRFGLGVALCAQLRGWVSRRVARPAPKRAAPVQRASVSLSNA